MLRKIKRGHKTTDLTILIIDPNWKVGLGHPDPADLNSDSYRDSRKKV